MKDTIKRTPEEWQKILRVIVLDPDGWDRSANFMADWAKPLTEEEFRAKSDMSTTMAWKE